MVIIIIMSMFLPKLTISVIVQPLHNVNVEQILIAIKNGSDTAYVNTLDIDKCSGG